MKFDKLIKEVFSHEDVEKIDGYKKEKKIKKEPFIVQNGLNDVNSDGTLKKRKNGEIR